MNQRSHYSHAMWNQNENMAVDPVILRNKHSMSAASAKPAAKRMAFDDVSNTLRTGLRPLDKNSGRPVESRVVKGTRSQVFNPVSVRRNDETHISNAPAATRRVKRAASVAHINNAITFGSGSAPSIAQPFPERTSSNNRASASTRHYEQLPPLNDFGNAELLVNLAPLTYVEALDNSDLQDEAHYRPRHYSSQPLLRSSQEAPVLRRTKSRAFGTESGDVNMVPMDDLMEALYEDAVEYHDDASSYSTDDDAATVITHQSNEDYALAETIEAANQNVLDSIANGIPAVDILQDDEYLQKSLSETTEELWDESSELFEDEHGYTTAMSPAELVANVCCPYPQVSPSSRRSLLMAAEWVESTGQFDFHEDSWDISMVAEYADDILQHMLQQDVALLPRRDYMDQQPEVQWSMRSVLVDWIVQAHMRFNLLPETLFLAVNCVDRFLSNKVVTLPKLQLVGATALFIAAKYEEINCPSLAEMVYIVDSSYSEDEIRKAERFMLLMLNFDLGAPGPMSFLRRISKADNYDIDTRTMAKYFLEITMCDQRFVGLPQSYLAAAAHCLSRHLLQLGNWSPAHVHFSGYTYQQLRPALDIIVDCLGKPQAHHNAVFEKYSSPKFSHAATYAVEDIRMGFRLPLFHPTVMEMIEDLNCEADARRRTELERE